MPNELLNRYDALTELPSQRGKVVFVTGGTSGIGESSILTLAHLNPSQIYFTGRNTKRANALIASVKEISPTTNLTFIECEFSSLQSVKDAISKGFTHEKLDVLICNSGLMLQPPVLSKEGYEIQFAANHLAHALIIRLVLPSLLAAASTPTAPADVRIVFLSSLAFNFQKKGGIQFDTLNTVQNYGFFGPWIRYGQSKLANVVYAKELSRLYPTITTTSLHPGIVYSDALASSGFMDRFMLGVMCRWNWLTVEEGALSVLWLAFGGKAVKGAEANDMKVSGQKGNVVSGKFYMPVGVESEKLLTAEGRSEEHAKKLWEWTEEALKGF